MAKRVKAWRFYVEVAEGDVTLEKLSGKQVEKKRECLGKLGELVTNIYVVKMNETI